MAYLFGLLLIVSVPGIVIALLRPQWLKPIFGKFATTSLLLMLSLALFAGSIIGAHFYRSQHPKTTTSKTDDGLAEIAKARKKQLDTAPTTGDVSFEIITNLKPTATLPARISVVTPEKTADRLIKLNDRLIAQFRKDGQLNDATTRFAIDYFDDKAVIDGYFTRQSSSTISTTDKRKEALHYVAVMMYDKSMKANYLLDLVTNQKIKNY